MGSSKETLPKNLATSDCEIDILRRLAHMGETVRNRRQLLGERTMVLIVFSACFLVAAFFGVAGVIRDDLDALSMSAYVTASLGSAYMGLDILQIYFGARARKS